MRKALLAYMLGLFLISTMAAISPAQYSNCESASSLLNALLNDVTKDDVVVVVSHLGTGESAKYGRRRLENVQAFLIHFTNQTILKEHGENVLLTTGRPSSGDGYVDIVFRDKIFATFKVRHNRDLYVGDCAPDLDEYKKTAVIPRSACVFPLQRQAAKESSHSQKADNVSS